VGRVDGLILWANSHLLFWLSLIPAATAWMGENLPAPLPTAVYGAVLLMPAIAYQLLQRAITHKHGTQSVLARALGSDIKGKISPLLYLVGIVLAFVVTWLSIAIYVLVAVICSLPTGASKGHCQKARKNKCAAVSKNLYTQKEVSFSPFQNYAGGVGVAA
jgi:uncharacterized membrane protein